MHDPESDRRDGRAHSVPSNKNGTDNANMNTGRSSSTGRQKADGYTSEKPNKVILPRGKFQSLSAFSLKATDRRGQRYDTPQKKQAMGSVPAITPRATSDAGPNTRSNGDFGQIMAFKKGNDSDNVVTAATTCTAQNSSSSSECHDANQTAAATTSTTTTASSGSGGDDDDRGESSFTLDWGAVGDSVKAKAPKKEEDNVGAKDRSNRDRQKKYKDTFVPTTIRDGLSHQKKFRHQEQDARQHHKSWSCTRSIKKSSTDDDGSTLQVPGDDGSDSIVAGDIGGGVPIKPATVVASRLFTPHTTTSKDNASSSTTEAGVECKSESQTTAQNQHHLLLPPHREPGYQTIRNTLYRFQGSYSNSHSYGNSHRSNRGKKRRSRGGATDLPSTEETTKAIVSKKDSVCNHHHHRHGDRSSGSSVNTNDPNTNHKRSKKRLRSNRNSVVTNKTSNDTGSTKVKDPTSGPPDQSSLKVRNAGGNSSGSGTDGTEDGYAGSVSSNENGSGNHQLGSSSPSPSVTSSEECEQEKQEGRHKSKRRRSNNNSKRKSSDDPDSSSEIADFSSSGSSETVDEEDVGEGTQCDSTSSSPSLSSSHYTDSDGLEMSYLSAKRDADAEHERMLKMFARKRKPRKSNTSVDAKKPFAPQSVTSKRVTVKNLEDGRPPILAMGCDIMAHVLTFLHPPEILDVLTMPLSKYWRHNFTSQPELWRVLCLVEPFKANITDPLSKTGKKDGVHSSSDASFDLVNSSKGIEKRLLDKYRLLYTSFVRCMKYIAQIRDDAVNGRSPAYIDYGLSGTAASSAPGTYQFNGGTNRNSSSPPPPADLGSNRNLQLFLAQARDVVLNSSNNETSNAGDEAKVDDAPENQRIFPMLTTAARVGTAHKKTESRGEANNSEKKNGPKFGRSMITSRLLGSVPGAAPGDQGNLNLPWSCAIYSIVNWMVAFCDVEGIQILCLKVLPVLLENEQHRLTAQHAGLADIVLRDMVIFSESAELHIAAFHTIVLLARPHGGREGMMFRTSMTADGIFRGIYQQHGKSGIAVMLDSMRRFQDNATLSAMSCWALVNIALVSDQKAVLVKLGGIQAITNAMYRHPFSAELQFRALFALINLVIPSVQNMENNGIDNRSNRSDNTNENGGERAPLGAAGSVPELGELNETTEREIIDELVRDIASLVVRVMKIFCSSEAILNRACLVLHNLSLTDDYHVILLWTPHCYQMLEWCIANFRTDQVLQQSATGTLHRLQSTLACDEEMRSRFSKSLRAQQKHMTLNRARDENHSL